MVSIFEYLDYRCFLKEKFSFMKRENPHFSIRLFNRLSGAKSTSFLKNVMDGKRNLADDGVSKIAKGFKMSDEERRFFTTLVKFNQAITHQDKNHHFQEMTRHRKLLRAKLLDTVQYQIYSKWYYVAILELVRLEVNEPKTLRWIYNRLHPQVGIKEVKKAIQDLKLVGLLMENEQGEFQRQENMLSTPDSVRSIAVTNFHIAMSEMAAKAIARDKAQDREFSALTIAVSEEGFERAKIAIRDFRKTLHSLLENEEQKPKLKVAQINLQMFRLDQIENERSES